MKNSKHQVVILKHLTSPYIHQAILVLKDYEPCLENQVIADAEKIINNYLAELESPEKSVKIYNRKKYDNKHHEKKIAIAVGLICLCGLGYLLIHGI